MKFLKNSFLVEMTKNGLFGLFWARRAQNSTSQGPARAFPGPGKPIARAMDLSKVKFPVKISLFSWIAPTSGPASRGQGCSTSVNFGQLAQKLIILDKIAILAKILKISKNYFRENFAKNDEIFKMALILVSDAFGAKIYTVKQNFGAEGVRSQR